MAAKGQEATTLTARPTAVARTLLLQTPVMALLVGVPGLGALAEGQTDLALSLLIPTALLGGLGFWSHGHDPAPDLRRVEAVVTLTLVFLTCAALTVPAFISLGLRPLDAFFEGMSGITTTGLSVSQNAESWPISGHLLRAWMQWCGGVVVSVAGIVLLSGPGRVSRVLGRESVGQTDYHASTRSNARVILKGYIALTAVAMLGSFILIPGWWEGPVIALAAVSTGGFSPRDDSLASYDLAAQLFVLLICVASSLSLMFYATIWKRGPRAAWGQGSVRLGLLVILGSVTILTLVNGVTKGWDIGPLWVDALNQISAQTTAGFSVGPVLSAGPGIVLVVAAMMIGGNVGSTTGGLKTTRVRTLVAMFAYVLLRLRMPDRAIAKVRVGHQRVEMEQLVFAGGLLSVYLVAALGFWLALMIGGHSPLSSVFDAVSALSGVGLSTGVIGPDMSSSLKIATIVAMLAGRLEFFALIVLFLPATWFNRR